MWCCCGDSGVDGAEVTASVAEINQELYAPPAATAKLEDEGGIHWALSGEQRCMAILVNDKTVTLFNPVRLPPAMEEQLLKLGKIASVVCLGRHHSDGAYYVDSFGAKYFASDSSTNPHGSKPTPSPLKDLDLPGCKFVTLRSGTQAYAFLRNHELIVTGDFLDLTSGRPVLDMAMLDYPGVDADFGTLKTRRYRHCIAAQGAPLRGSAKPEVDEVIRTTFPGLSDP